MARGDKSLETERLVLDEIRRFLLESGRAPMAFGGKDRLADLGMTSLDVADLVAALNTRLAANPFRQTTAFTDLQTVADLIRAYRPAGDPAGREPVLDLEESRQRALARRAARRE